MDKQHSKTASRTYTNSRNITSSSNEPVTNDYRLIEYDQQSSHNSLKITISTQKSQPGKHTDNRTSQNQHQSTKQEHRNEQHGPKEQQPSSINFMNKFGSYNVIFYCCSGRQQQQAKR
jgi:hypothetical protein